MVSKITHIDLPRSQLSYPRAQLFPRPSAHTVTHALTHSPTPFLVVQVSHTLTEAHISLTHFPLLQVTSLTHLIIPSTLSYSHSFPHLLIHALTHSFTCSPLRNPPSSLFGTRLLLHTLCSLTLTSTHSVTCIPRLSMMCV